MSLGEFDLIARYFAANSDLHENGVAEGIGDDCALLDVPAGHQLAVSTDTLVCDVHFFADVDPYRLGYKALAVNLSDLAAMGATPKWASLAITLPEIDEQWLAEFSRGFFSLAKQFNVSLVGGDTTKGPLSITVSVKGVIPRGQALLRSGAKAGELICVSGNLGDGGVGLDYLLHKVKVTNQQYFRDALELAQPRNDLGENIRGLASSCIDISDGLAQDLGHILKKSSCSAVINIDKLPLSLAIKKEVQCKALTNEQALHYALTGGDDYELLFTISAENLDKLTNQYKEKISVIGKIEAPAKPAQKTPLIQLLIDNKEVNFLQQGWDHFQQGNK